MLDIRQITENKEVVARAAANKNVTVDLDKLLALSDKRRALQQEIDIIERQRNVASTQTKGGPPSAEVVAKGKELRQQLEQAVAAHTTVNQEYFQLLEQLPNLPTDDTPIGRDADSNLVLRQVGEPPTFSFTPRDHVELGNHLDIIDTERAAKVSGSRFTYLKRELAHLEFALIQFTLAVVTNERTLRRIAKRAHLTIPTTPFIPIIPPTLITPTALHQMARLEPREDRYHIPSDDLYLVGSAEHTLGAMHGGETLPEDTLPLRYVGFSTSFRRESGSYGKDVKGILRLHQFDKIEFESFSLPELSLSEQDFLVAIQEHLMQALQLPYRVVLVSTGDMGKPDARQIDIETWLPGQNQYRETHSADLTTDYQSRRLKIKVKRADGKRSLVHMNDATAFAIGRTLIAIMENYQEADGSIIIPKALRPYVPFKKISRPS